MRPCMLWTPRDVKTTKMPRLQPLFEYIVSNYAGGRITAHTALDDANMTDQCGRSDCRHASQSMAAVATTTKGSHVKANTSTSSAYEVT
ncbi:hypothetical protein SARC_04290 [Sphaeroforma arctica JP610]|uniref:Uncharacterized protein n=1 Tax=Sphaeroforma arctica JP610 TaxID=667725 RepID=A0A0L0G5A7_9EUKA|nr:hypothetical protein SARC_04290 [Sphaeroforma arctica JP610]KNC83448.1 hypothetical protein SARC_04290 [Sphaeroforma arctica JP610]|eukprot:XP_014157350.1 hypothetical protein SARC_04290 [Sphaeroforma arctica JP610]